ncbi:unnamed protein product [Commensalibacter communis]|uniref:Uncharacterized protein n=1 Tax=Commensalibacter communis TaxID=2972786 RepID=A0A9W4XDV5_9PROT|nr:phage tail assembly protein [Commensalibacter communis]CAI3953455.1 unnamed protein product [Commensalibacter communis]CAI3956742.1 unnamed protein product [Commensalibacter communis]
MEPTKIITLKQPVTVGSATYSEIHLREPIVNEVITSFKDMNGSIASSYDAQIKLVSIACEIPIDVLEEMPTRILDEAIEYVSAFQNVDDGVKTDQWDMELDSPLQLSGADGDVITTLSLKEPTVKQRKQAMKAFDQYGQGIVGGLEFQVSLLTQVTGEKLPTILKLPISQFTKATVYLMRFFPEINKTGNGLFTN